MEQAANMTSDKAVKALESQFAEEMQIEAIRLAAERD